MKPGKNQRVPVLVYHHVYTDEEAARFEGAAGVIGLTEFRRQLQWILTEGWNPVSTTAAVDWLLGKGTLPERACVVHFDNGWLDTFSIALPYLTELGVTATCFPITSGIAAASSGDSISVRTLTEGVVENPFMDWQQLGHLAEQGWQIGAHTHTHGKVADQHDLDGDGAVLREVEESHSLFQKHLGFVPEHFAYPSGSRNDRTDEILLEHYQSLRLWRWDWPISWKLTDHSTPVHAIESQNVDSRVSFEEFQRIFHEAGEAPSED